MGERDPNTFVRLTWATLPLGSMHLRAVDARRCKGLIAVSADQKGSLGLIEHFRPALRA